VVYKLHCVAPEWIKKNKQQLAKAARRKPMFKGFLKLLNAGNKRTELPREKLQSSRVARIRRRRIMIGGLFLHKVSLLSRKESVAVY
jgi:hypothetical protein